MLIPGQSLSLHPNLKQNHHPEWMLSHFLNLILVRNQWHYHLRVKLLVGRITCMVLG